MSEWREKIGCQVVGLQYNFGMKRGFLYMQANNCCDMAACIQLFELIDPAVRVIETFASADADTLYVRNSSGWVAFLPNIISEPGSDMIKKVVGGEGLEPTTLSV